uniref:Uncharacterized protein n=1 Tax=Salvator merianae TaxID=96440 RepID=A0A8D0BKY5_SALMN
MVSLSNLLTHPYREDNGIPVHLKGGTMATALYRTTTLTIFGTGYTLLIAHACYVKKKSIT